MHKLFWYLLGRSWKEGERMPQAGERNRRGALKQLGLAFLGLLGWPLAKASANENTGGVFASLFLQKGNSVQIPLGYYDPKTQRYLDAKTHKPIFAPAVEEKFGIAGANESSPRSAGSKQLSDKDLENLLNSGSFVDMMALEKVAAFGGWCTLSQLTTLSTTTCCPIVTDSSRDRQCDDTTPNPPS
jgi:hypothetical protein